VEMVERVALRGATAIGLNFPVGILGAPSRFALPHVTVWTVETGTGAAVFAECIGRVEAARRLAVGSAVAWLADRIDTAETVIARATP